MFASPLLIDRSGSDGKVSFESFRRWALSDNFPETGRHDFIGGRYVKDLAPEPLFSHNTVKGDIAATLMERLDGGDLLTMTRGRVTMPQCQLSVQPDTSVTKWRSFETGRVTLTPHPERADDAIEVVGPPDLIVEIVSDESATRDGEELFDAYFRAGVREYWLIDARAFEPVFRLLTSGRSNWNEVHADPEGFVRSVVFERCYRFDCHTGRRGERRYDLIEHDPS